jgi:hypothetical protein
MTDGIWIPHKLHKDYIHNISYMLITYNSNMDNIDITYNSRAIYIQITDRQTACMKCSRYQLDPIHIFKPYHLHSDYIQYIHAD